MLSSMVFAIVLPASLSLAAPTTSGFGLNPANPFTLSVVAEPSVYVFDDLNPFMINKKTKKLGLRGYSILDGGAGNPPKTKFTYTSHQLGSGHLHTNFSGVAYVSDPPLANKPVSFSVGTDYDDINTFGQLQLFGAYVQGGFGFDTEIYVYNDTGRQPFMICKGAQGFDVLNYAGSNSGCEDVLLTAEDSNAQGP